MITDHNTVHQLEANLLFQLHWILKDKIQKEHMISQQTIAIRAQVAAIWDWLCSKQHKRGSELEKKKKR